MSKVSDLKITQSRNNQVQNAQFLYQNPSSASYGNNIQFEYNGTEIFDGYVAKSNKQWRGTTAYDVLAVGRTADLYQEYFNDDETYSSTTVSGAIHDLISVHHPNWYTSISGGISSVDNFVFDSDTLIGEGVEMLCDVDNLRFYVDFSGSKSSGYNHLHAYPIPSTYNYSYSRSNVKAVKNLEETKEGFVNYQVVKGGVGYIGEGITQATQDSLKSTPIAQSFYTGDREKLDRIKLWTSNAYDIPIRITISPCLYNVGSGATVNTSDFSSSSNITAEDTATSGSVTLGKTSSATFDIPLDDKYVVRSIWWNGDNVSGCTDFNWHIDKADGEGSWIIIGNQDNEGQSGGWHKLVTNDETDNLRFYITNGSTSGSTYYINNFAVFASGWDANRWWEPDMSHRTDANTVTYTPTSNSSYLSSWITFTNPVDISSFNWWACYAHTSGVTADIGICSSNAYASGNCHISPFKNPSNVSSNVDLTFNVGWADKIIATSKDNSSIAEYGKHAGKTYYNSKIKNYSVAESIANKIVDAYNTPITRGSIEVGIEPAMKLGDKIRLNLPDLDVNNEDYEVVGFTHLIDAKGDRTIVDFGAEAFDPGALMERVSKGYNRSRSG